MTTEYTPDEEHMEVAWIEYEDAATDISEAGAQFDRFLARVRRDAAREALDGLMERATQRRARAMTASSRERHEDIYFAVQEYRDTHYPEETP